MPSESIRIAPDLSIPREEVRFRVSRSSGPGGQHAQRTETRVEALFDVERSPALSPAQRQRLVARLGPVVRTVAQDERSQARNRELALERLVRAVRGALREPRPRRPTRPSPASIERRLAEKERRSDVKRGSDLNLTLRASKTSVNARPVPSRAI